MPEGTNIRMALAAKPHHRELLESCAPNAKFTYKPANEVSDEELAAYDAILGVVPPARMNKAKSLKFVQLSSAGSDAYMAPGVLPEGAVIANATGSYGLAISEYLMGVLLSLSKRLHQYRDRQPQGVWGIIGEVKPVMGSTVLVVGLGDIGGEFAKRAKALGARVIGVRRKGTDKPDYVDELILTEKLDEYLPIADCVAITLPGTKETKGMFGAERLNKMKDGAVLLNVGRGMIVDSDALVEALQSGKLSGAAVDVTDPEPLPAEHPLWQQENAVITPHVSGGFHLPETHDRIIRIMAENLSAFRAGRPLRNVVDFETGYRKL